MFKQGWRSVVVCGIALAFASAARAQSPQANDHAQDKVKKHANQVPETGVGDTDEASAADTTFEKATNVTVTTRSNGTLSAALDDSFMEAETVTRRADGTLEFRHFTGLDRAIRAVLQQTFGGGPKGAKPAKSLFPVLEEKE